ncbi:Lrp/AsnC family transcriptional regulator [Roseomonas sp. NAR14]|uniref:Lrp/AsnC family transcriptional regulator n=1 Tax=Roseomonas acroporae TaxID=2937791 RepID=A0A9X2BU31_9PROT|nr:Lrp/AsnC family transcriptional regulator [Roseomonas acroporae]MCK8785278.1 Lrp/AsnC family transcriptional regulator [Roseomonas acroporae]
MHDIVSLDAADLRLLAVLQEDGRLTNQEAGERVGLSASQCSRRRTALEAAGLIRGYRAELAAERLGLRLLVFIQVTLATHTGDNARRFRELVARLDAVQEAYAMTGDTDYLLKAVLPDLQDLSALVNDVLLPHGSVARVRSSIVLERLKESGRLPLAALRGRRSPEGRPARIPVGGNARSGEDARRDKEP